MKLHNAINIIYRSLVAYIEDSAGQGSEEAKEIDEAYSLVNSQVSIDIHDVGMIASVMTHNMFDRVYEKCSDGCMGAYDLISVWALQFHKLYEGKIKDWADEDELKSLGFKKSQCWDEAIMEFVESKIS